MQSLILRTTAQFLIILLLLFSVFLLLRGHHAPGGGFSGGLVAAAAFALYGIAEGVVAARKVLRADPRSVTGVGLLLALGAGAAGLAVGKPFLSALWWQLPLGKGERFEIGTPLLFDTGVYLAVLGITLTILFTLAEE